MGKPDPLSHTQAAAIMQLRWFAKYFERQAEGLFPPPPPANKENEL